MRAAEQASYTTINKSIGYDGPAPDMMDENCIYRYILENEMLIQVYVSEYSYILV